VAVIKTGMVTGGEVSYDLKKLSSPNFQFYTPFLQKCKITRVIDKTKYSRSETAGWEWRPLKTPIHQFRQTYDLSYKLARTIHG